MKPVFQTQFGQHGNCLTACVATLLGLPLEDVPELIDTSKIDDPHWLDTANERLAPLGYGVAFLSPMVAPAGRALMYGDGGRGWPHVVVARDGVCVHDPMPGGEGIAGEHYGWLVLLPICAAQVLEVAA